MSPTQALEGFSLANVALSVRNIDEAIHWYSSNLGFQLRYRTPAIQGIELALIEHHGVFIDLIRHPQAHTLEPVPQDPPQHLAITGLRNLVFFVDDLAATNAHLKANGVPLIWEANVLEHLGTGVTTFRDMDGNLVALWERNETILARMNPQP